MATPRRVERRRHVRVVGGWKVTVTAVELGGTTKTFDATMLDISTSGVLLEAAITANLWADRPLTIDLPGGVGPADAIVRRFLEYGLAGSHTTRWGVELANLTVIQRALWGRFVYTEARHAGHPAAHTPIPSQPAPATRASALADALHKRDPASQPA
jgi:hypothetical protein